MLFYFLISIVFIAELIIAISLIICLFKLSIKFSEYNSFLDQAKPSIKELMITIRKISEQFTKLAPMIANKIKSIISNIIMGQIKSAIGALTFWLVKKEVEKHV